MLQEQNSATFFQVMKIINRRARLTLYLLLSIELLLVSGYLSWVRPHTNAANVSSSPAPAAQPDEPGM
jgi:hypothetical protein